MANKNMNGEATDLLCPHCNATFAAFLHDLAEKNARVVCPSCGKEHGSKPPKAGKPGVESKRS
jgi:predicted Zn finger-like uncharacterized protein